MTDVTEHQIDGATLRNLTESMVSELLPVIRSRVQLLKLLSQLPKAANCDNTGSDAAAPELEANHQQVDDDNRDMEVATCR